MNLSSGNVFNLNKVKTASSGKGFMLVLITVKAEMFVLWKSS